MEEKKEEKQESMNKDWKKATAGEVMKFAKEGDSVEGKLIGFEPSKQYADSFAVKIGEPEKNFVVFVSKIAIDLILSANIQKGQFMKIVYLGKKTSNKGKEYNDYEVFYK